MLTSFRPNEFADHADLNDLVANESVPWMSWRATRVALRDFLNSFAPHAHIIFADPRMASAAGGTLHTDFHRTAQALKLPDGYHVEFQRQPHQTRNAISWIQIVQGNIELARGEERRKLSAGDIAYFDGLKDTEITAINDAQIIQAVSPTNSFGRTLLLPEIPPTEPIVERFQSRPDRLLDSLIAAAKIKDSVTVTARKMATAIGLNPPPARPLRLLDVHAHPDDEVSKGAATRTKYLELGHEVTVVTATTGNQGSILNPALENDPLARNSSEATMSQLRLGEANDAQEILGHDHIFLEYPESGMPADHIAPPETFAHAGAIPEAIDRLAIAIRARRPDVVIGYGPENSSELADHGAYTHLDHDAVYRIVGPAIVKAGNPAAHLDTDLPPWIVAKHYHHIPWEIRRAWWIHRQRVLNEASSPYEQLFTRSGLPKPTKHVRGATLLKGFSRRPLTRENCARYLDHAQSAADKYRSQIGDVLWTWLPQERFRLAGSLVPGRLREHSLFAGIADTLRVTDPHQLLGVRPGADVTELDAAWRAKATELRPSTLPGETEPAAGFFTEVRRALPSAMTQTGRAGRALLRTQRAWELLREQASGKLQQVPQRPRVNQ